ncbi:uncharacterized protein MONOS_12453 [Monocercomonoides exilis]|uniref:uncharacterized protein n=1 Tax=Monocercomonoides exilis TaxID=2049356 RepID=UPI003559B269|nr:hypothetical protein MONOS_12453 [Monocercomonoides exilis]|eukprot:MONOS_12453.1-p1 / transcript=MONOS_12453.1 / gene=MONOS_12453 / organism=Monocercomonoides_exilis_PA203 / gene_product=unspecified product / transcript_product=unspecified product / location=Mono_scaffold00691:20911-21936(-) / protein_length=342 / sequence_SO=supercontig / SO=protein_coding / is_pseudo=false
MVHEDPEIEEMFVQEEQKRRIRKEMMKKKTIGERIKGYQKPLYNYKKVSREFKNKTADETVNETGQNTGHYIDIRKIDNLAVVDIDINKAVDEERKERIRQSILLRLPENVGLVQTGNGGLHIYCDRDEYPLKTDSQTKVFKCSDFEIDVFACVNGNRRFLVQADTEIIKYTEEESKNATKYIPEKLTKKAEEESDLTSRYDDSAINQFIEQAETRIRERVKGDSKVIKKYIDLNNYLDKSNLSSLEDILNIFGIDIRYDSSNDDTNKHLTTDGINLMSKEFAEVLVCGFTNVSIHNYCHFSIDKELSLFPLFCAVNSLINIESVQDEDIDAYYQEIKNNN